MSKPAAIPKHSETQLRESLCLAPFVSIDRLAYARSSGISFPQRLLNRPLEIHTPPFLPRRLRRIGAELGAGAPEPAIEQCVPEADSRVIDAQRVEHGSGRAAQPKRARGRRYSG